MVDIAKMNFDQGSWQESLYEVYAGITVGSSHGWYFLKKNAMGLASPVLGAFGIQTGGKKKDSLNEASELKVIGVGYGRTGTVSLLSPLILLSLRRGCHRCVTGTLVFIPFFFKMRVFYLYVTVLRRK